MAKQELMDAEFSYEGMDKDDVAMLRHCEKEYNKHKNAVASGFMSLGETLLIAHERLAKRGNGWFQKWVESKLGCSKSSAYNYMAAFRVFGDCPTVGQMEDGAIYALASKETPEKALKEVLKLTANGAKITQKQAKEIIKKHTKPKSEGGGGGTATSPAPSPPKPEPTKEELLKLELKKTRSYAEGLVRALDDCNRIKRNTVIHPQLLKLCGQILEGLERW